MFVKIRTALNGVIALPFTRTASFGTHCQAGSVLDLYNMDLFEQSSIYIPDLKHLKENSHLD